MKVKIIANEGNDYYDQFIGQEFEATKNIKDVYTIKDIQTKTPIMISKNGKLVESKTGTQWSANEVEEILNIAGEEV